MSRVLRDIVRLGGVKGDFASDRSIYRERSDLVDRVIKMAGKDVRSIVNQFHVNHAGGPHLPGTLSKRDGAADAGDLEDHVSSLGIEAPDVTQAEI